MDLCDNCGHQLPNAAGPGRYCANCGEPVNKPRYAPQHRALATLDSVTLSTWVTEAKRRNANDPVELHIVSSPTQIGHYELRCGGLRLRLEMTN